MKKKIVLEAIDPVEIYGPANKLLEIMCGRFPELKVVARGNELLLEGSQADVTSFNRNWTSWSRRGCTSGA